MVIGAFVIRKIVKMLNKELNMLKYSVSQWIFGEESIAESIERLKKYHYDGIELAGEPNKINIQETKDLLKRNDMVCTSLCGIYTEDRNLSSSSENVRTKAIQYLKDCIDMAAKLGAPVIIVVPSPVGKLSPDDTCEEAWEYGVDSLKKAGEYAAAKKIKLAIEAINRYETFLVYNLELALKFVNEVNSPNVQLMADSFHMNIEERNNQASLQLAAPRLIHIHIADNTREAAGMGKIDFKDVMSTLKMIGYKGCITMEFLPPVADPYQTDKHAQTKDVYDAFARQSIEHMKKFDA